MKFTIKITAAVLITAAIVSIFTFFSAVCDIPLGQSARIGPLTATRSGYRIYYLSAGGVAFTLNLLPLEELLSKVKSLYSCEDFYKSESAKALEYAFLS